MNHVASSTSPSFDLNRHLSQLDHGQLQRIIGDAGIFDLISAVINAKRDIPPRDRGQIILDLIGGPTALLEDKRYEFFLTFSEKDRESLRQALKVDSVDSFSLTESRRQTLYQCFDLEPAAKAKALPAVAVSAVGAQYGLFPHQTKALLESLTFLESDNPRVMLHMPTGSGKTRTAFSLICRHLNKRNNALAIWLVAGKELCEQAASEFSESWSKLGDRPVPIISLWDSRTAIDIGSFENYSNDSRLISPDKFKGNRWPEDLGDGLIVASVDTLRGMLDAWEPGERKRRLEQISLIVFDEAHRSVATTYKQIIEQILLSSTPTCGLLGLSATPGRRHFGADEDSDSQLVALFGNQKVQLEIKGFKSPVAGLISQGYLARLSIERLEIANSGFTKQELQNLSKELETSYDLPSSTLRRLGLNATRNLQIVTRIEKLVKEEACKRAIVFAPSVESSHLIASLLKSLGIRSSSVSADTDPILREKIITEYKTRDDVSYVLCNYGVLSTGFDAPQTSAVIIARPTLSIVLLNQMAGRAIRGPLVKGNEKSLLITVVDTSIPELVNTVEQFHAFDKSWGGT